MVKTVRKNIQLILSSVSACLLAATAPATTIYVVPPDTPGVTSASPFNTWTNAATNISIIGNVTRPAMGFGDEFIISNGEYLVYSQINPRCQGATIRGVSGDPADVVITPAPAHNGILFYHDNGVWGADVNWADVTFSNARGRAFQLYKSTNVTYTNCVFVNNSVSSSFGGAINGSYSADGLRLVDCVFRHNTNTSNHGGAVYSTSAYVSNCLFDGNRSVGRAGGLHLGGSGSGTITSYIYNCVFSNNLTSGTAYGGGGYNNAPLRMYDCEFFNNVSSNLGGGWSAHNANTIISGCRFSHNSTPGSGWGGGLSLNAAATVTNCVFDGNSANSVAGGLVFYTCGTALVANCVFSNNTAKNGGAIGFYNESRAELRNCLLVNNTASNSAGGIYLRSVLTPPFPAGTSEFTNRVVSCTIVDNYAPLGGGIEFVCPPNVIINCVIYSNRADTAGTEDLYNTGMYAYGANTSYFFCCTSSNFPAGENITNNPVFANYDTGDYRLGLGSPCVNKGTNLEWMAEGLDLDGKMRVRYGIVDIGGYEYIYPGTFLGTH